MSFSGCFIFHDFINGVPLRSAGYTVRFISTIIILEGWKDSVMTIEYPHVHLVADILGGGMEAYVVGLPDSLSVFIVGVVVEYIALVFLRCSFPAISVCTSCFYFPYISHR